MANSVCFVFDFHFILVIWPVFIHVEVFCRRTTVFCSRPHPMFHIATYLKQWNSNLPDSNLVKYSYLALFKLRYTKRKRNFQTVSFLISLLLKNVLFACFALGVRQFCWTWEKKSHTIVSSAYSKQCVKFCLLSSRYAYVISIELD